MKTLRFMLLAASALLLPLLASCGKDDDVDLFDYTSPKEYVYIFEGDTIILDRVIGDVLILTDASPKASAFIRSLSSYGEVTKDSSSSKQFARVKTSDEMYYDLIALCHNTPSIVQRYTPVLVRRGDTNNTEIICTGEIVVICDTTMQEDDLYRLAKSVDCTVKWKSPFREGKYTLSLNGNDCNRSYEVCNKLNEYGKFEMVTPDFYVPIEYY